MNQYRGQQFGNYQLLTLLGTGGFAEVYLGEHLTLGTQAAIKVLTTPLSDQSFLKEARTLASLQHPHIIRIRDYALERGIPYLVMDYAVGGTLRQRYPDGTRLTPSEILPHLKQITDALQFVHSKNFVHCDIKPQNLLLDANDNVLLSDFGIVTEVQSQSLRVQQSTQAKTLTGTLDYIAPEQWEGKKPTHATDQYALGIVVYERLAGHRPFSNPNPAVIANLHVNQPPPPLSPSTTISPAVEYVLLKALAKDPRSRFPSTQTFADAMELAINEPDNPIFPHTQAGQSHIVHPTAPVNPILPHSNTSKPTGPSPVATPPILPNKSFTPGQSGLASNSSQTTTVAQIFAPNPVSRHTTNPYRRTKKKRPLFDLSELRTNESRLFLFGGGIIDIVCSIPIGFTLLRDANIWLAMLCFMLLVRFFCTISTNKFVARLFCWVSTIYWPVGVIAFLLTIHFGLYMLVLLFAPLSWFMHDYLYAGKKPDL